MKEAWEEFKTARVRVIIHESDTFDLRVDRISWGSKEPLFLPNSLLRIDNSRCGPFLCGRSILITGIFRQRANFRD